MVPSLSFKKSETITNSLVIAVVGVVTVFWGELVWPSDFGTTGYYSHFLIELKEFSFCPGIRCNGKPPATAEKLRGKNQNYFDSSFCVCGKVIHPVVAGSDF